METNINNNDGGGIRIFQYQGSDITFNSGQSVMVNATQMAKPFGKRPAKWLELPSTKEFLSKLSEVRKSDITFVQSDNQEPVRLSDRFVETINGKGTWMHEDVALEFARWLSPEFAIWCNDRIKELLRVGMTATQPTIDRIIADPASGIRLLQALQQERGERQRLQQVNAEQAATLEQRRHTIALQSAQLQQSAPKVSYYEQTLLSASTLTMTQVAKSLGLNVDELTSRLKTAGIIYRQSGQWLLKDPYCHWDLHKTRTAAYTRSDGQPATNLYTVWTERGRRYITALHDADFDPRQALRILRDTLDPPADPPAEAADQ
jgi:phage antirepressor YoqD-like protein